MVRPTFISGAFYARAFVIATACVGNVEPGNIMYNGFVVALGSYAAVAGTLRLHDMGFSGISFGADDSNGLISTVFTRG